MYKYKCYNCNCKFDEPDIEQTTYESYYGVSSLFSTSNPMTLYKCPNCGSDDIEEIEPRYFEFYRGEGLINNRFKMREFKRF